MSALAPARLRSLNRLRVDKARQAEIADAVAFLTTSHDFYEGELSRDYDPLPYPEAVPTPEADYVGTGIGFLYGLGGEEFAWQLAGWNVRRAA